MDTDDDSRPTHGLLVSLLADATGRQRLLFDDVRAAAPPPDTSMFLERFYATAPRATCRPRMMTTATSARR